MRLRLLAPTHGNVSAQCAEQTIAGKFSDDGGNA